MIEDIEREQSIFEAASDLTDAAQRSAYLKKACGGDTTLLARLEKLLLASESAEQFFAGCAPTDATVCSAIKACELSVEDGMAPGGRIGDYRLLEKIGE